MMEEKPDVVEAAVRDETPAASETVEAVSSPKNFFVVGIGASAGGLEALEQLFGQMVPESGLAFVIIQHLSPDYKSMMAELLAKHTTIPVHEARDGLRVEPNNIYLIPPRKNMTIFHCRLHLTDREIAMGLHLPIDIFFRSLAEDAGEKAIAIILSGTGSDGTRGLRVVKERGGLVMVQDEKSAKFDGMPRSAMATQLVDYILPPERMAQELLKYTNHPQLAVDPAQSSLATNEQVLDKIFAILRSRNGVDFTCYKEKTIARRLEQRMSVNQVNNLDDYLMFLYRSTAEVDTLYKELLIGVTQFFRDGEVFDFLQEEVVPLLLKDKYRYDQVRVWVPGCSTGEEAYSLAILLNEVMERQGQFTDVKIFATDIDQNALEFASRGYYPESIAAEVSWERLKNYFAKKEEGYEVKRLVREMVIFARQDVTKDPPFSKIDLISCRNLMIYLQPPLQKKLLSTFQFSLKQDGFLVLGNSETISDRGSIFVSQHPKWKVYQYKGGWDPKVSYDSRLYMRDQKPPLPLTPPLRRRDAAASHFTNETIYRHLIEAFLPPCVVVNEAGELLHIFGDMSQYLKIPSGGAFTANILKMVRQDLSIALSTAIHRVVKEQQEVIYKNISIKTTEDVAAISLVAKPFVESKSRQSLIFIQFVVTEQEVDTVGQEQLYNVDQNIRQHITDLEQELEYTKENLQATIEELETSNEELQATNEELMSANEELQSTNEELQSVNEELITVNAEFQAKISELTELSNDMNSTDIATLFLDDGLRVRKFTPAAQQNINLMELDLGRPISHISHNFQDCDLVDEAQQVMGELQPREREISNQAGQWYLLKAFPYRAENRAIHGVVMTFVEVTPLKQAQKKLQEMEADLRVSETRYRLLAEATFEGVAIEDEGRISDVNPAFAQMLGYDPQELVGHPATDFVPPESLVVARQQTEAGYNKSYQVEVSRKDGVPIRVEVRGKIIDYQGRRLQVTTMRPV